jgi:Flp pilus assembly protein TadD
MSDNPNLRSQLPAYFFMARLHILLICLAGLLIYSHTIGNDYALDDGIVLLENRYTLQGIKGIPALLTRDSFAGFLGEEKALLAGGRYRPLSLVSFAVEYAIFGKNPALSHAFNIFFYLAGLVITYILLQKLEGNKFSFMPLLATFIFALHPIHTEAVANIKGRDELLSWFFIALGWALSLNYIREKRKLWLMGSGISLFLALLSKENGIMALFFFPLSWKLVKKENSEPIPYRALLSALGLSVLVYLGMRLNAIGWPASGSSTDILNYPFYQTPLLTKWATIAVVLLKYLQLLVFPYPLSFDYSYPSIRYYTFTDFLPWVSVALNLGLTYYGVLLYKKGRLLGFFLLFYFLSLVLVSNLFFNLGALLGERLLFQASLGFCIALAYGILATLQSRRMPSALKRLAFASLFPLLALYGAQTWLRNQDWKNNITLYLRDVKACPQSCKTNKAAGESYITLARETKDSAEAKRFARQALHYLERALELYPRYTDAWLDIGTAYYLIEDYEKAQERWLTVKKEAPEHPILLSNLAILEERRIYQAHQAFQAKNYEAAIRYMQKALILNSSKAENYYKLGLFYGAAQDFENAINALAKATELSPNNAQYWYHLGGAYYSYGKKDSAQKAWKKSLELAPNNSELRRLIPQL